MGSFAGLPPCIPMACTLCWFHFRAGCGIPRPATSSQPPKCSPATASRPSSSAPRKARLCLFARLLPAFLLRLGTHRRTHSPPLYHNHLMLTMCAAIAGHARSRRTRARARTHARTHRTFVTTPPCPARLPTRTGLALINGTQMMTAVGAEALHRADNVAMCADIAVFLTWALS